MSSVYQTVLENHPSYIFVTNVNVPSATFGEPARILQRIADLVNRDYDADLTVYFEVSATYTLVHRETGETRRWVGSFSPQQTYTLTPNLHFSESFFEVVEPLLDLRTLVAQLGRLIPDTEWSVDEVNSLVVHVSSQVPRNYRVLVRKGLLAGDGAATGTAYKAKVKSFDLP